VLTAPGIGELVTVSNVPMVSTGIDYPTSTGLITFTEQHLSDLVASQDDPAIHSPRTKIGHSDPRFNGKFTKDGEMLDGEPSLGTWKNLRLSDNNQTVVGDVIGVPLWFAAIVSTAYPSRSIEGNFDVTTVTGHKWSLIVDAVAMLGVIGPGVTTLDDLPLLFSEEGPSGVKVIESKEGEPMSVIRSSKKPAVKATTVDDQNAIPGYAEGTDTANCGLCVYFNNGNCMLYASAEVEPDMWCPRFVEGTYSPPPGEGDTGDDVSSSQPVVAETVSNTAWSNFKDSDYDDAQYARAAVYDRGKCGSTATAKERYSLPVREPSGTLNKNGVHAAASRLGQVTGGCEAAKKAAATTLVNMYKNSLKEDPPQSLLDAAASAIVTVTLDGRELANAVAKKVNAQANLDDVRRQYYDGLENTQTWWWIRAIYLDPNELIVDDDEGGLYRVGFDTSGDTITFNDPTPVQIQYVDQPTTAAARAIRASVADSLVSKPAEATYTIRADSRPGGCMTPEEAAAVRERHGLTPEQLPDDADDATVARVVIQASSASPAVPAEGEKPAEGTAPVEGKGNGKVAATGITSTEEAGRVPQTTAMTLPDGTIMVDKATWDEVAGQARQGAELAARTRDTERDEYLNHAIKAGKFPPSRKEHWLTAWKADPEGTRGVIESLAPGLVPVEARGTAGTGKNESIAGVTSPDVYDQSWLTPAERHRVKSSAAMQQGDVAAPMIVQGGD
jgi:hypothetical protein